MRGVTLVLATAEPERLRSALGIALGTAALGGRARLFLDIAAVPLLRAPMRDGADDRYRSAGLPTLDALIAEALEAGVELIACQAGLALAGLAFGDLRPGCTAGGMISLLQSLNEDRLLSL